MHPADSALKEHIVIIYGPGCARCEELELRTRQAVNSLSGRYDVRHERDAAAIAAAGVLATPALALDGKLLLSGKVPNLRELQQLLADGTPDARPAAPAEDAPCCCCCGGKGCCDTPRGGSKKWLWWVILVVLVLGAVKYVNHRHRAETAPQTEQQP